MKTKTFLTLALAALLLAACGSSGQADQDAVNTQVALLMEQNAQAEAPAEEQVPEATEVPTGPRTELWPAVPREANCTPANSPRSLAVVTDIWSGDSIQVEMNGQTYEVRYIGIDSGDLPADINAQLVEGKEVFLISDTEEMDEHGRLPRYVIADGVFVNLELVRRGAAFAIGEEPNTACDQTLRNAQP